MSTCNRIALALVTALLIGAAHADGIFNPGGVTTAATLQQSPGNPTGTTSNLGVMMGLGSTCQITPAYIGRFRIDFDYQVTGSALVVAGIGLRFADNASTATPANAAALTGTSVSVVKQTFTGASGANAQTLALHSGANITGLTLGHLYWFDLTAASNNSSTVTLSNVNCYGNEY